MDKILCVVNNPKDVTTLIEHLSEQFHILVTPDPAMALKYARIDPTIRIVFSDYKLPFMDGNKLLAQIKEVRPKIFRILLSDYEELRTIIPKTTVGVVQNFISKPWDPDILNSIVSYAYQSSH